MNTRLSDDFQITPPLLDERSGMICGYAGDCPRDAVWHIFWTVELENSAACDEHYEAAKQWAWYTAHRSTEVCAEGTGHLVWLQDGASACVHDDDMDNLNASMALGVLRHVDLETGRLMPAPGLVPA
tara:strand:+ start:201 stop:581 length:381 start_codon:yes stop_codon:yes gene_type:complete